ncbi:MULTISPECIES: DUF4222 domain-containing protein [Enterobacteriaceae]|uniref:DUF4222 domain-containing protein n=1 Tax=Lelliottia amnigena TaxID=61646 RepID=A0AAP2F3J6_LELAM|nr:MULTISPECIES: DUF4222 domain-containing protein [Enterobacteriaceae]MBL5900833.1 DUF4222 domain-containing protein [Lelliottia amnigena]MBL5901666.1 DUF4222 domain-containing protein [Lelliottia amnigena]MBL5912172.1 DUF4222 domain-containing protein [Enterobacter asburiae]MBL5936347.1 DUF4222 domain-containing protein [Lelliottia amnigena]MBL5937179.1 DUF4222 domain-containing protein [Lelliottia amnigena]
MVKKINQAKPEGIAQPKIEAHSRWKNNYGEKITVKSATESRITYVRDGYENECVCSGYRFSNEFTYLPEETEKSQAEAREKVKRRIAEIRSTLPLSVGSDGWDKGLK